MWTNKLFCVTKKNLFCCCFFLSNNIKVVFGRQVWRDGFRSVFVIFFRWNRIDHQTSGTWQFGSVENGGTKENGTEHSIKRQNYPNLLHISPYQFLLFLSSTHNINHQFISHNFFFGLHYQKNEICDIYIHLHNEFVWQIF